MALVTAALVRGAAAVACGAVGLAFGTAALACAAAGLALTPRPRSGRRLLRRCGRVRGSALRRSESSVIRVCVNLKRFCPFCVESLQLQETPDDSVFL